MGAVPSHADYSGLAETALNAITDGVLIVDETGVIKFANPAAARMTGYGDPSNLVGLSYQLVMKLETLDGAVVDSAQSKLAQAIMANQAVTLREYVLVAMQGQHKDAIALTLTPTGGPHADKIITFRDITKELAEEEEQSEFISTASHEMRTPVASIEGYLGLALNPQTATIDARARQYLEAAHASSQHLGRLFKDLLDVTKLDDGRMKPRLVPVDIVAVVREMARAHEPKMQAKHLKYSFGTADAVNNGQKIEPLVYAAVDLDFMREILDNLIENAIKYTPDGGEIWVNARGDGDKVLINVTDTGIGISPEDAAHVFQKFYRVDNSQTRAIGGTGLGLYLVKQRVEALGGRVWVESAFGEGSTFFVSLPRLSDSEYERLRIAYQNEQAVQAFKSGAAPATAPVVTQPAPVVTQPAAAVTPAATAQVTMPVAQTPSAQPAQMPTAPAVQAPVQMPAQPQPVMPVQTPAAQPQPVTTSVQAPMPVQPVTPQAPIAQPQTVAPQAPVVQPQPIVSQAPAAQPVAQPQQNVIPPVINNNQKGAL